MKILEQGHLSAAHFDSLAGAGSQAYRAFRARRHLAVGSRSALANSERGRDARVVDSMAPARGWFEFLDAECKLA